MNTKEAPQNPVAIESLVQEIRNTGERKGIPRKRQHTVKAKTVRKNLTGKTWR